MTGKFMSALIMVEGGAFDIQRTRRDAWAHWGACCGVEQIYGGSAE